LRALLGAVPAVVANRKHLTHASVLYARNMDQLVLALLARLFAGSAAPVAYEVLDIPPILTRRGAGPMLLRAIERYCLARVRLLVLSSPGFHRHYFEPLQQYRGAWHLMENKLDASVGRMPVVRCDIGSRTRRESRRWVVGYFGLIRGDATFDLMTRLAARLGDRVEFRFRGVLTTVDERKFRMAIDRHSNMNYAGPYVPQKDLAKLYRDVDFAWALDLEHISHNSRWLLPCRFYEAGYFGVPCLAVRGFEIGNLVEQLGIGWTFSDPLEENLVRFFETLEPAAYDQTRRRLEARPESQFVSHDVGALCAALDGTPKTKEPGHGPQFTQRVAGRR
jgi:succinoglycan biosynthesis protein ExoL